MTRFALIPVLFACACATRSLIPSVALHGVAVFHQRTLVPSQGHARDFALTVQLAFLNEPHRSPNPNDELTRPAREQPDAEPCLQSALCEWASLAEESALQALGVAP
jgi:hypothetical protein